MNDKVKCQEARTDVQVVLEPSTPLLERTVRLSKLLTHLGGRSSAEPCMDCTVYYQEEYRQRKMN